MQNNKFQYSENNKSQGTKAVFLTYAGFSLSNKLAFYMEGSNDLFYISQTSLNAKLASGLIKAV